MDRNARKRLDVRRPMTLTDRPTREDESRTAIVILGAAVHAGGVASPTLRQRIAAGAAVAREHPEARVVVSGGLGRYPPSEAEVMCRDLEALGIPRSRILLEDRSTSTQENATYSIAKMRENGLVRAIVVTDSYHLPRAVLTFRALGIPARGFPARPDADTPLRRRIFLYMREMVALPAYMFRLIVARFL